MEREQIQVKDRVMRDEKKKSQPVSRSIFSNYLINPIKKVGEMKLPRGYHQGLKSVYQHLHVNQQKMIMRRQIKQGQQGQQMQSVNRLICYSCKDINYMLVSMYFLFLKSDNKTSDIFELLSNKELLDQERHWGLRSTVNKLRAVFSRGTQYYIHHQPKPTANKTSQYHTHPLLMSYVINSNAVLINSKLILDFIKVLQQQYGDNLTSELIYIVNRCLQSSNTSSINNNRVQLKTVSSVSVNSSLQLQQKYSYFVSFQLEGRTEEHLLIVPSSCEEDDNVQKQTGLASTQMSYKLFLFPNQKAIAAYLKKIQLLTMQNQIKKSNNNPQNNQSSPCQLFTEQQSKDITQQQQPKLKEQVKQKVYCLKMKENQKKKDAWILSRKYFVFLAIIYIIVMTVILRIYYLDRWKQVLMFLGEAKNVIRPFYQEKSEQFLSFFLKFNETFDKMFDQNDCQCK